MKGNDRMKHCRYIQFVAKKDPKRIFQIACLFFFLMTLILYAVPYSDASTLSVQMAQPPTAVTLSTEGTTDWAHWGLTDSTSFNHKSGITQQISNYTRIGSTVGRMTDSRVAYSWTGGTPTTSTTGTRTGLYFKGVGNGYRLTIPAKSTESVLKIYLGLWIARGRFEARLSDGSVPPYVTYLDNATTTLDRVVTITFSSPSSGVDLIVEYIVENTYGNAMGNITLQAATLVAEDQVPIPTVATPTITPSGGTYTDSVSVTLATQTSGASIRYTTNGTEPTSSSTLYTAPFTLTQSCTLRAKAFLSGYNDSTTATASFIINTNPTVATENIYICLGYRLHWVGDKTELESLLRSMGAVKDGVVWRYTNQKLKKEFAVRFIEDMNSMKLALQEENAHVLFIGHSNYGLGPVFATKNEINSASIEDIYWIDDPRIFSISSPWVATSVRSIRTNHSFPNWWPEFQDGTSGIMPYDFNDPSIDPPYNYYITYRIPGDPNLYKVESTNHGAIERFPDSGKPAWYSPDGRPPNPTNPDEIKYFIVNPAPVAPSVNMVGDWTWSREASGYFKENYFYLPAGTGQNRVEWIFTIDRSGYYNVFAWWPAASNHTTSARYSIGENIFVVDQTKNGGKWNQIGQFYLEPGNYSVVLSDLASSGRVVADGVKITALNGTINKEIDNMIYPARHYSVKTIVFRKDLEVNKENLRYSQLFYDSCNSGNYFLDTFNRGVVFFTVNDSMHLGFNAYLKAYLEGKSRHEIWTILQSYEAVYDYYDFNKLPSEQ